MRTSAAARRACSPSCRSRAGASGANVAHVGGSCRSEPGTRGVERANDLHLELACAPRVDQLSAEGTKQAFARPSAGATGASPGTASSPRRSAGRGRSGAGTPSGRRRRRGRSGAARGPPLFRRATRSGRRQSGCAQPISTRSPTRSAVVSVPSRRWRVASLECFVLRASENGPAGRTTRSRVNSSCVAVSAFTPRSYARRRMGSASSPRPRSRRKFAHSSAACPASARRP